MKATTLAGQRIRVKTDGRTGVIIGASDIGEDPNQLVRFDDDQKSMMVRLSLLEVQPTTSAKP